MTYRLLSSYRFGRFFGWLRRNTSSRRKRINLVRNMYLKMGLKENGCKLCGCKDFTLLAESDRYGFDLKKQFCNTCGLVQTYPTVSDEFLNIFYSSLYRSLYTKAAGRVNYSSLVLEQRVKGRDLLKYCDLSIPYPLNTFNLIEMGCSSGGILYEASLKFKTVLGCDLDVDGTAYARSVLGLNVETGSTLSRVPIGPNIFLMSHVREHLNDPLGQLKTIRSMMKKEDFFIVIVPGINAVKSGDYKYDLRRYFHIAHLSDFSAGTLETMGVHAGLECLKVDESVCALFKLGKLPIVSPQKNPKDTLNNILDIEHCYR